MYHATYCWFQQMYPEDSTSSGPGTYGGWSCGRSTEHPPAPPA